MRTIIDNARHVRRRLAIAVALTTLLPAAIAVGDESKDFLRRWAVLASKEVRDSGLPDLLSAKLSQTESVELVEREQVDLAARELELSTLLGAQAVGRLDLGRRLRADALLLLSHTDDQGELRVVICECRQGARIGLFEFPTGASQTDELADQLTRQVVEVRKRFGAGIRLIVGVTPFLSKNLEHDYDHLQSRWSDLLGNRLSLEPGVAVIEVEEAQAILKEPQPAEAQVADRVVPFVVNGHFRVTQTADGLSQVKIDVEVSSGGKVQKLPAKTLPLAQATAWIVSDLTAQLLTLPDDKLVPLSAEQQKATLSARADSFSRLGDWRRSIGLREAVLVLDADNAVERARLVNDYQQRFGHDYDRLWSYKKVPEPERLPLLNASADRFATALEHFEYLVRNRRIGRDEALALFSRQRWEGVMYFGSGVSLAELPESEQAPLIRALDAERAFILRVFPALVALPRKSQLEDVIDRPRFKQHWNESLLRRVLNQVECLGRDAQSLAFLEHVLTDMLPADDPSFWDMQLFLRMHNSPQPNDGQKFDDWIAFLKRLAEAKQETARLYGRLGLFEQTIRRAGGLSTAGERTLRAVIAEADGILDDFSQARPASDAVFRRLTAMKRTCLYHIDPALAPDSPVEPLVESLGRLRIDPIDLVVAEGEDSKRVPLRGIGILGVLNCSDQFDLFRTEDGKFYTMRQAGVLRELPLVGEHGWTRYGVPAWETQVAWDGELIWLGKRGYRLDAMLPDGTHVAAVDGDAGLPDSEKGLRMLAIAPRKILVVGSFGELSRAWCAMVEVGDDGKPRVNVFHEARRVVGNNIKLDKQVAMDPANVFVPEWIHRFDAADGRAFALVGRFPLSQSKGFALRINLNTLEVDVFSRYAQGAGENDSFFSRQGHFLQVCSSFVAHYPPENEDETNHEAQRLCGWNPGGPYKSHGFRRQIVPYQGWLYIPGSMWFRIHQQTFAEERLCKVKVPQPLGNMRFCVSAHYGLIGYRLSLPPKELDSPVLYAITIADEAE